VVCRSGLYDSPVRFTFHAGLQRECAGRPWSIAPLASLGCET
jgi:hypothetical protein